MGSIVLLDELTINKIAAGEVIERPASVVKEMIENSIDAGANNITIEVQNGGISLIKIIDNGKGISKDDMELAFERHATSKIRKADDLENVLTMGFRGEALASIAAISRIEMISKTQEADIGYKIVVEAGKIIEQEEFACNVGTTISVTNLFFNTPVRYKFLKKDYTESGYIEDAITRLALVNPNIAFKLINSSKTILQTNGSGELKSVIYSIYGKETASNILEVNYDYEDMKITGVVGKPSIARSNKSNQMFFVNKRYVKDKTLTAATDQAFRGMLPVGKFAFLVINIEMNPANVDVNVHPAKLEVRFEKESDVFKAIFHSLKESLLKGELVSSAIAETMIEETSEKIDIENKNEKEKEKTSFFSSIINKFNKNKEEEKLEIEEIEKENLIENIYKNRNEENQNEEKISENLADNSSEYINQQFEDLNKKSDNIKEILDIKEEEKVNLEDTINIKEEKAIIEDTINIKENIIEKTINNILDNKSEDIVENTGNTHNEEEFGAMFEKVFGEIPASLKEKEEQTKFKEIQYVKENLSIFNKNMEEYYYKYIGVAFSTYILLEIKNEIYVLDQHAAHERIMYEKIKENYYQDKVKDTQMMLMPDVITLTHKELDIVRANEEMFKKAGFIFDEFGDNTIKLNGVPNICIDLNTKQLFLDILDEIDTVARTARQEIEEKFIATIACKSAIKANMAISKEEVDALMKDLLKLPNPFTCPHGRPTAIKMSKMDIEKKFNRR